MDIKLVERIIEVENSNNTGEDICLIDPKMIIYGSGFNSENLLLMSLLLKSLENVPRDQTKESFLKEILFAELYKFPLYHYKIQYEIFINDNEFNLQLDQIHANKYFLEDFNMLLVKYYPALFLPYLTLQNDKLKYFSKILNITIAFYSYKKAVAFIDTVIEGLANIEFENPLKIKNNLNQYIESLKNIIKFFDHDNITKYQF